MELFFDTVRAFWLNLQVGIVAQLGGWNYVFLAFLVAVEGPIVTLLGAVAAGSGYMSAWLVFLAASIGNMCADFAWYNLGKTSSPAQIVRRFGWLGIKVAQIEKLEKEVLLHAPKIIFLAKLTSGLMVPTLLAAGMVKSPPRHWFPFLFCGELVWTGTLVFLGFHGALWLTNATDILELGILIGSLLFLLGIVFWVRKILQKEIVSLRSL